MKKLCTVSIREFPGCGAEFFCDRRQEILPDFAVAKNVNPAFCAAKNAQSRNRTSDTRIFSPLLYQLSYLGILISCWKPLLI